MKAVIRNNTHGNGIVVCKHYNSEGVCESVSKSSSVMRGILALQNESVAYGWYNSRLHKPLHVAIDDRRTYFQLKIEFIEGQKADYRNGLVHNEASILSAVKHYCMIWSSCVDATKPVRMHGDLTLDNIISTATGPVFTDWEHSVETAFPIGFDGLYLLFSSLYFESKDPSRITNRMSKLINSGLNLLDTSGCLHSCYRPNPLSRLLNLIRENITLWRLSEEDPKGKLPLLFWTPEQGSFIDRRLSD